MGKAARDVAHRTAPQVDSIRHLGAVTTAGARRTAALQGALLQCLLGVVTQLGSARNPNDAARLTYEAGRAWTALVRDYNAQPWRRRGAVAALPLYRSAKKFSCQ